MASQIPYLASDLRLATVGFGRLLGRPGLTLTK
jgi:hypothetical protein